MNNATSPANYIPSRPSEYNGQRFNSRLESSWAIFFDVHRVEWVYEPYQLRLPTGEIYLPDFYLPALTAWFEVKGLLNFQTCAKPRALREVVAGAGQRVIIGSSDGTLSVPYRGGDGRLNMNGAILSCRHCAGVWFTNPNDPSAARCMHCGSGDGGSKALAAARAAIAAGVVMGWNGNFSPYQYRHLVTDPT